MRRQLARLRQRRLGLAEAVIARLAPCRFGIGGGEPFDALSRARVVARGGLHRAIALRRPGKASPAQVRIGAAQTLVDCARQRGLRRRQIHVAAVVAAYLGDQPAGRFQIATRHHRAGLLEQIAEDVLARLERFDAVGLQRQHTLEQRQRRGRVAVEPTGRLRLPRLFQQRFDAGIGGFTLAQLLGHRGGFRAGYLQFVGQCERGVRGGEVPARG